MPERTKLLCNKCFQPLDTVEYPEGVYINPCDCMVEVYRKKLEKEYDRVYDEGYHEGAGDMEDELNDQIRYLEKEIAKLETLVNDDEQFNKRMGL